MTVAYSDTFPVAGGCHCNRLDLYNIFQEIDIMEFDIKKLEIDITEIAITATDMTKNWNLI